jgi:polyhydroxybutyrate depolymerase
MHRRTTRSRWASVLVALFLGSASSCIPGRRAPAATAAESPGTADYRIQVGALERTYMLHVPTIRPRRLGRDVAYSLVIVLHGSGASGETVRRMSEMDALADSARFLVAYPNGTTGRLGLESDWNAGECCGTAESRNVDDVAFIHDLIAHLATKMPVDRRRVYVAGFSDGGRMAYRLACTMGAEVAAVAVVSGSLVDAHCAPTRAVPIVAFHGTADTEVPYQDSSYSVPPAAPPPAAMEVPPAIRFWAGANRCGSLTLVRRGPHVTQTRFNRCAGDVVLFTIEDGLHAWPGGASDGAEPTHEISASRELWRFFTGHPLR